MKTSNKIFIGFISFLILLAISIMFLLKSNFVPTNTLMNMESRDYGMGDIDGIKADGEFIINPFLYNGDSWVKIKSPSPIPESFTVYKDERDILILGTQDEASINKEATVSVKLRACRSFDLGGGSQMQVEQPFKGENISFNFKDRATATVPISADTIRVNLIDQSSIYLKGRANVLILNVNGQTRLDAEELEVNEAIVSVKDKAKV